VGITTVVWIGVTLATKPTDLQTLIMFIKKVYPGGPGWRHVLVKAREAGVDVGAQLDRQWDVPSGLLCAFLGLVAIYSILFSTGFWLYQNILPAMITTCTGLVSIISLLQTVRRVRMV
jgi:hypothetical protein